MKYAKFAAVVLILFFLGYVLGPTINPMLVKEKAPENPLEVMVEIPGGAKFKIDLQEYRGDDLPKTVKITKLMDLATVDNQGTKALLKDDVVKLLNRKDNMLIVETMDGLAKGEIDPRNTDIYQTLALEKLAAATAMANGGKPAPAVVPAPAPANPNPAPVQPAPVKPVEPVAVVDPTPAPTPDPTMPAVEPTPDPVAPEPAPVAGGDLNEDQIVEIMKASIAEGKLKEFKADQVKGWKAGEKETVDGTEYQTGMAAYEAATIFGVKAVQAKALIKDGKVERWVYAKSGMEIQ